MELAPQAKRPKLDIEADSRSPQILSSLEKLPRELAFAIFDYTPESVQHLRLSSRVLHSRTGEYARLKSSIQLVDELRILTKNRGKLHAIVSVPKRTASLFELRIPNDSALWDCIAQSAGSKIGRVSLIECGVEDVLRKVSGYLRAFQSTILEVEDDGRRIEGETVEKKFLDMIAAHEIEHLKLKGNFFFRNHSRAFLVKLASILRSMHFCPKFNIFEKEPEIIDTILEMLSQKLDKMFIQFDQNSFTTEDLVYYRQQILLDRLIERIPFLGKEIWFQTSIHSRLPSIPTLLQPQKINDHEMKVVLVQSCIKKQRRVIYTQKDYFLSIIHKSRSRELPQQESAIYERAPAQRSF